MSSPPTTPYTTRSRPRPRLVGERREAMRRELATGYAAMASIRALAAQHDLAYGTTRLLLLEAGVRLRNRGKRSSS